MIWHRPRQPLPQAGQRNTRRCSDGVALQRRRASLRAVPPIQPAAPRGRRSSAMAATASGHTGRRSSAVAAAASGHSWDGSDNAVTQQTVLPCGSCGELQPFPEATAIRARKPIEATRRTAAARKRRVRCTGSRTVGAPSRIVAEAAVSWPAVCEGPNRAGERGGAAQQAASPCTTCTWLPHRSGPESRSSAASSASPGLSDPRPVGPRSIAPCRAAEHR